MNGRISTELKPRPGRTIEEELAARLDLLDGEDRFALLLWRLPEGVPFDRFDLDSGPTDYIQCAGGVAGRFMCEVRRVAPDGRPRHEVIGRGPVTGPALASALVPWSEKETSVQANEVLSRDEVAELFTAYLAHDSVPAGYECRELVL
jgi:hypothetical protein